MRILFIAPRFHTNQVQIIKFLKKKNKVFFNSIFKGKIENYENLKPFILEQNIISKFLDNLIKTKNYKILYFPKISNCYKKFKKINPDIVIIRMYGKIMTYIYALIIKCLGKKILFYEQCENDFSHLKKKKIRFYLKKFEIFFQNLIFDSRWFTPLKKNNTFQKNCFFLPFLVALKKKTKNHKGFNILVISKYQKRKNVLLFLKAINMINSLNKYSFTVTIIGEANNTNQRTYHQYCNKYIKKNNMNKIVKLKKNVPYKKIFNYYEKSKLFVLPSKNEPASISVLEAIGYSVPVICSDTCGTRYYLNKNFSRIFKSDDINSLTKSIIFFLENKKNFKKYSHEAFSYAKKNLSEINYLRYLNKIIADK